ncbi:MAG: pyridoxamine 5'-phosphate oxidase family protein [Bdellovibrionota bacterium]
MNTQNKNRRFLELLEEFHTLMFITHNGESLHARPMAVARLEPSCEIWFITDKLSAKIDELQADPRAYLTCQKGDAGFISLSGIATLVPNERATLDKLWRETFKVWFPLGKDDPAITLIRFEPVAGEYWDGTGANRVKYLYEALKAYVTDSRPDTEGTDQHGVVKF